MAIKANNFFNLEEEARTQGTLGGKPLSKEERKEAFKKQGTIGFKTFVQKVFNKKQGASSGVPKNKLQNPDISKIFGSTAAEKSDVAERVANAFDSRLDDLLKNIREDVGGILAVVEKQVDIDEEEAKDAKNELEKNKRTEKEEKGEKQKKEKTNFLDPIIKPMKGLWESIVGGFMKLLAGWGITQFLKWFGNPKNAENVKAFKEFVVNAVPVVIKGILALIALDIGLKVLQFVKLIALGSASLLKGLIGLSKRIVLWAAANPWIAGAIGLGVVTAMLWNKKNKTNQNVDASLETQGSDATVSALEQEQQEKNEKGNMFSNFVRGTLMGEDAEYNKQIEKAKEFNEGGFVSGPPGTDRVPARLTAGEFVMSRGAVEQWGADTLAGMNAGGRSSGSGYNEGGEVDRTNRGGGLLGRTGKVGYLGDDRKINRFSGPKNEAYFLQVQRKTGEIEIWNEEWGSDKYIGTMDPNTRNIQFNEAMWGGARPFEVSFFSQQKNKQMVAAQAHKLIKQAGASREITQKKANQLLNNPPGKHNKGKVVPVAAGGGQGAGGGGGGQGDGQGQDVGLFSPIDTNNHYLSLVAAMCNIISEDV